jgi:hypothetical protein
VTSLASTMLRATISATLLLPTALLGAGCSRAEAAPTPKAVSKALPTATKADPELDMSYIFKGSDAELKKRLKLAGFKKDMTKKQKLAVIKGVSAVVERMQKDDARLGKSKLPRTVRDGAAIWNHLSDLEKLELLEENPAPDFGVDQSNWAAAAVGIAVAGLAYQVAKDEKWINDKQLKDLQIRTFTVEQLDYAATLADAPLMIPGEQFQEEMINPQVRY